MTRLLALLIGAIYPLGFAPFDLWPITLGSVFALVWLLDKATQSHAWILFCFAVGKYGVGASWVYVSMNVYGNAPPLLAGLLVVLFVLILACFHWPAGWVYGRWRHTNAPAVTNVLLFAAVFIGTEWVLTWLFTGFPWLFVGHSLVATPLQGLLPVFGTLGSGLLVVTSMGLVYVCVARRAWQPGLAGGLILLAGFAVGHMSWVSESGRATVALVQGNLEQNLKWRPEEGVSNVRKHLALTQPYWDADLIVWPEAAITMFDATSVLEHIDAEGNKSGANVVVGIPSVARLADGGYEFKNTALALGTGEGRFAKHHLVPFGEYVPFESLLRGAIEFFDLPMSSTTPGPAGQGNLQLALDGARVEAAMAICYEIAYGESMRRHAARAGVIVTISNDTWFGASLGPLQHMQIAQVRAAENGRWLLRATNNGVTAIVDDTGRITARLPQFEANTLRGEFAVMQGRTPYSRLGDWPALVFMLAAIGISVLRRN